MRKLIIVISNCFCIDVLYSINNLVESFDSKKFCWILFIQLYISKHNNNKNRFFFRASSSKCFKNIQSMKYKKKFNPGDWVELSRRDDLFSETMEEIILSILGRI